MPKLIITDQVNPYIYMLFVIIRYKVHLVFQHHYTIIVVLLQNSIAGNFGEH